MDELRIRQILLNLVGNAVKFTSRGGVILRAKLADKVSGDIVPVIFEVEDTGIGIPESEQSTIFDSFRQMKDQDQYKFGGTGLGLAITKRLVEMMHGELKLESKCESEFPGMSGSLFSLYLECEIDRSSVKSDEEIRIHGNILFEPARILVADDVELNRKLIIGFLEDYPFEIIEAANGLEAVELSREKKPDVVIMDIKMPVISGDEATRILKSDPELKHIPVIALTASILQLDKNDSSNMIYDNFLSKPVSLDELLSALILHLKARIKIPEAGKGTAMPEMNADCLTRLPDTIRLIEEELFPMYSEIKNTIIMGRIEAFAVKVIEFSRERGIYPFLNWGEQLLNDARTFDMEKLPADIELFNSMLDELKEMVNKKKDGKG